MSKFSKILAAIAFVTVSSVAATLIGVGGADTHAQAITNEAEAVAHINSVCNSGSQVLAHAAYGRNPSLDMNTGVVTYDFRVLWKRCNGGYTGEYAVTGYNGEACPGVGHYHNGWDLTRDCVKYTDRHGEGRTHGVCGSPRCVFPGFNAGPYQGGYSGPPADGAIRSRDIGARTVTIPDWNTVKFNQDSANVFVARLCGAHYRTSTTWGDTYCMDTFVRVTWTRPFNFQLNPAISAAPSVAEPSAIINVSPSVNNTGTTQSSPAQWQVTSFTVPRGAAIPNSGGGRSNTVPTTYFAAGQNVSTIAQGTNYTFPRNTSSLTVGPQTVGDLEVGTRLCFALSVQPYRHDNTDWNHSAPFCVTIAKSPKVQVLGNDLIVGRQAGANAARTSNINTSVSNKSGTYYGSWGEYALVPSGTVSGMASGSGYVGGSSTGVLCSLSILTFTVGSSGGGCSPPGNYTHGAAAPNVTGRFLINVPAAEATPSRPASPPVLSPATVDVSTLSGQYQLPVGRTSLTLQAGSGDSVIGRGQGVVINAPGATVTIRSNIVYTGEPLSSLEDIPQVVIIADNIIIADNVTTIDAWLVAVGTGANGRINTCGTGAPGITENNALTDAQCNQRLTINGPIMANHLIMRRTAGSGTGAQSGDPAEVFNLRADAYFWATNYHLNSGRLSTAQSKELPPRY